MRAALLPSTSSSIQTSFSHRPFSLTSIIRRRRPTPQDNKHSNSPPSLLLRRDKSTEPEIGSKILEQLIRPAGATIDHPGGRVRCDVLSAYKGTRAFVYIQNSRKLNSLTTPMLVGLTEIFQHLASREDVQSVVLSSANTPVGSTKAFSTGADISVLQALRAPDEAERYIRNVKDACQAIRDLDAVTVAAINGFALGAGLELAASCDFRYATRRSTFGMPEVRLGIPSVVQARLLANIIGWQKTKQLVYLGRNINATTAHSWGLVDGLATHNREIWDKLIRQDQIAISLSGVQAMKAQKRLVRLWEESDLISGVDAGVESFANMFKDGGLESKQLINRVLQHKEKRKEMQSALMAKRNNGRAEGQETDMDGEKGTMEDEQDEKNAENKNN
ncbi:uncharacterized protein Z518_02403 [Rhinocladiella mackenziei CBS 650.93]|uniref:Rhinocladiella mackenziei CBS 650.93 unplaced genomic scaffold supercont1.2, whole genome shotgun sequence n=1 Tax=Rhinocladiella mackenziei CBS 650.93 TaxID=1442369 RepID=A0A0D2IPE4_9EURO|nr:uncharacterized protein Z518_02403 [Rhinocladiella mackenziei CBS 650.93]KIX07749.1 hypothetical protein Z518_02403 [Rhinocladiella mackenziei CBS 650.93]